MSAQIHKTLARRLRDFAADRSGNITMMFAISAIPFIAAAGIALDYSRGVSAKTGLQQIADAAALAAAAPDDWTEAQRTAAALKYVDANKGVLSGIDIVGKDVIIGPNTVDVALTANIQGTLTRVMASNSGSGSAENAGDGSYTGKYDVGAKSKAAFGKGGYMCLEALHPSAKNSVYFYGNVEFLASSCSVHTNSTHAQAMYTQGNAYAEAASFCAVGGWVGSGYSTDPTGGCPVRPDPYTAFVTAADSAMATAVTRSNSKLVIKNNTPAGVTLQPGIYNGGISIETAGKATLSPGTYYIRNGTFSMSSSSEVYGNGVTIYLVGNGPTTGANKSPSVLSIGSQSIVNLKAPTSGPLASMVLMQSPTSNANDVAGISTITSGGNVNIEGGVYFPEQTFTIHANGDMNQNSDYFPIIAKKFEMGGTATLYVNLDWQAAGFPDPETLKTQGYHLLTE
jgi:Flp pilus assembly protein TadG